ncbi:hypothetical protein EJ04DRAFT_63846 [Polyplosphaeria fusca]|uniref:Uncharacterized protein n=1 Tax=Polyplosphaeria fusca TaxID=682080 RepID=A0A9P4UV75_9PLEO|nr:hypothetical protein EJ04DRAFT_63846 [Polyplosphaeria fusca]
MMIIEEHGRFVAMRRTWTWIHASLVFSHAQTMSFPRTHAQLQPRSEDLPFPHAHPFCFYTRIYAISIGTRNSSTSRQPPALTHARGEQVMYPALTLHTYPPAPHHHPTTTQSTSNPYLHLPLYRGIMIEIRALGTAVAGLALWFTQSHPPPHFLCDPISSDLSPSHNDDATR